MKILSLISLIIATSVAITAHATNPRIIGILGGRSNESIHASDRILEQFRNEPVALYDKPNLDPANPQKPVKEVKGKDLYPQAYLTNRIGAKVYGFKPLSWYMVGYEGRAWWIDVLPNMAFYDYYTLITNRTSYMNEWDWKVYDAPNGKEIAVDKARVPSIYKQRPPVEVVSQEMVDGEQWFRVKILDGQCYEHQRPDKTIVTGWVPAYAPNNDHTIWFNPENLCR